MTNVETARVLNTLFEELDTIQIPIGANVDKVKSMIKGRVANMPLTVFEVSVINDVLLFLKSEEAVPATWTQTNREAFFTHVHTRLFDELIGRKYAPVEPPVTASVAPVKRGRPKKK